MTELADLDSCPHCGGTSGVQLITDTSPKVEAWSCTGYGTQWVVSPVNRLAQPHSHHRRQQWSLIV
ncbi:MAG: hypothetical protein ACRDTX_05830 [Pseudonocardiaceae bacterium]